MNHYDLKALSRGLAAPPSSSVDVTSPVESVTSEGPATDLSSPTVTDSNDQPVSPVEGESAQKRKRGRPRKHPVVPVKPKNGRSRTGCITCRKRKKKCDETKPECLNCKHMNKVCEGFYPSEHWKSGRQKSSEYGDEAGRRPLLAERRAELRTKPLPNLIDGVDNEDDRMLFEHFAMNLSQSLCLWDEKESPFDTIIIPMALSDLGLMHAILCLSGSQLASGSSKAHVPEDAQLRASERRHHHLDQALRLLREKLSKMSQSEAASSDDATIATVAILCMQTVIAGDSEGQYRFHLDAGSKILLMNRGSTQEFADHEFRTFMANFFVFQDISCLISSSEHRSSFIDESFRLPSFVPPDAGSYLGVLDGLFVNISKITNLRGHIRKRAAEGREPLVDAQSLTTAQEIESELQAWPNAPREDTPRSTVRQLYRQCTWIYLHRTIYHRRPSQNLIQGIDNGLALLKRVQDEKSVHPVLVMPVFLLGCAAFEHRHRPQVDDALGILEMARGSRNIQHVRQVVHRVWEMMDREDRNSWDWESLMENMQLDFLIS